jgi:hypothetical protein
VSASDTKQCRECGKTFDDSKRAGKHRPYNRTAEGIICRNRPECRGRQLSTRYELRGLKRWTRHTQEQLLAEMDLPPANWNPKKRWKSIHLPHDRVGAAIEFYSTCWPVCLEFAVQTDADGEPIREMGEWKRHTHRSLAAVLHMSQSEVTRAIAYRKQRNLLTEIDGRLYPEPDPKLLSPEERDACTHIKDAELKDLTALSPKTLKLLKAIRGLVSPDVYTRIKAVAEDACTRLNVEISDARTRASQAVFDACQPHASLLSRPGKKIKHSDESSSSDIPATPVQSDPGGPRDDDDGRHVQVHVGGLATTPWPLTEKAIREYGIVADDAAIEEMVRLCRQKQQSCSDEELAAAVLHFRKYSKSATWPIKHLSASLQSQLASVGGYNQVRQMAAELRERIEQAANAEVSENERVRRMGLIERYDTYCAAAVGLFLMTITEDERTQRLAAARAAVKATYPSLPRTSLDQIAEREMRKQVRAEVQAQTDQRVPWRVVPFDEFAGDPDRYDVEEADAAAGAAGGGDA